MRMHLERLGTALLTRGFLAACLVAPLHASGEKELAAEAADLFCVVEVGEDVRIVKKSELPALREEIRAAYEETVKAYTEARAQAKKERRKFTDRSPARPSLRTISASLRTEEDAIKLRDKTVAELNGYMIVNLSGTLKVARKRDVSALRKRLDEEYKQALQTHREALKNARKSKQAFTAKAPAKPTFKVLASRLPSEEAANEKLRQLQERGARSKKAKGKDERKG